MTVGEWREALEPVTRQLTRIADVLELLAAPAQTPEPEPETPCPHPPEDRIDFSSLAGEKWECRRCGYRTP